MKQNETFTEQDIKDTITKVVESSSPKPKDWNNIMERTQTLSSNEKSNFFVANKYKITSIAASFLLVAVVSTLLVSSLINSPSGPDATKPAEEKESTKVDKTTTTTEPEKETDDKADDTKTTTTTAKKNTTQTTAKKTTAPVTTCIKSLADSCGPVVQNWNFKTPSFSLSNFAVYGYSFSENYPQNGIGVVFDVNASNIISSNTDVYRDFKNTSACVQVQVRQDPGTPNSQIAGQTFTATMCEDTLKYFAYSGYGNDTNNWSATCAGGNGIDRRRGTWPEPSYKNTSFDQGGYFAGPKFVPGNYTVTVREMNSSCNGKILAGPTSVTIWE